MELHATLFAAVESSARIIYNYGVRVTPLEPTRLLGAGAHKAFLKLESEQVTGSFKARGAVNAVATFLENAVPGRLAAGVVAASSGNHARGVAYALNAVPGCARIPASIHVPLNIAPVKLKALRDMGAPVVVSDFSDCAKVEAAARAFAESTGAAYISPYNDLAVAAGQGTVGLEIHSQVAAAEERARAASLAPDPLTNASLPLVVFVPVGGGGLISGVAAALKQKRPGRCVVIGTQPAENACMAASVAAGRILGDGEGGFRDNDTWSDGTAGGLEEGAFTFKAAEGAATDRDGVLALLHRATCSSSSSPTPDSASVPESASALTGVATAGGVMQPGSCPDAAGGSSSQAAGSGSLCSASAPAPPAPLLVDAFWLVSETAIKRGMMAVLDAHHKVVEGAAGTAVAAARELAALGALRGCTVVVVCCGGNVSTRSLRALLAEEPGGGSDDVWGEADAGL